MGMSNRSARCFRRCGGVLNALVIERLALLRPVKLKGGGCRLWEDDYGLGEVGKEEDGNLTCGICWRVTMGTGVSYGLKAEISGTDRTGVGGRLCPCVAERAEIEAA